jgi:exonuclease SbcC
LENEILDLTTTLQAAEDQLQTASSRLQSLETLRTQTEQLAKKETELQTNLANIEDRCARLANEIQRKSATVDELHQRVADLQAQIDQQRKHLQETGLAPEMTIDELQHQLTSLDEQMTAIRGEQEAARRETHAAQQRVSNLASENKCPLCLQPLPADYKAHMLQHIEEANKERETRLTELQKNIQELEKLRTVVNQAVLDLQSATPRIQDARTRIAEEEASTAKLKAEFDTHQQREQALRTELDAARHEIAKFDMSELKEARQLHDHASEQYHTLKTKVQFSKRRKTDAAQKIEDLRERLEHAQQKMARVQKIQELLETLNGIRDAYRSIQPKLRTEFIRILERVVQQVLDRLVGDEGNPLFARIDETYTPSVKSQEGYEREVTYLSGGERTLLAFAYRFALGQLIMQARVGRGLQMLLLDEPTESLGREDRSVDRLAEAIGRLKAIEQIIAVTHNEAFAEKAEHVIRLEKEAAVSRIIAEK